MKLSFGSMKTPNYALCFENKLLMKLIYRASDINEAHIVSGMLRSNGIESHVGGHYLQGGVGELAAQDFANVHVADEDAKLAKSIISEYEMASGISHKKEIKRSNSIYTLNVALIAFIFIVLFYYLVSL